MFFGCMTPASPIPTNVEAHFRIHNAMTVATIQRNWRAGFPSRPQKIQHRRGPTSPSQEVTWRTGGRRKDVRSTHRKHLGVLGGTRNTAAEARRTAVATEESACIEDQSHADTVTLRFRIGLVVDFTSSGSSQTNKQLLRAALLGSVSFIFND